ncbi:MAG: hypothetical protein EXR76_11195 [Myxococcales bacterium]|nr:hypothetical protein [Myxococcales bacterium]
MGSDTDSSYESPKHRVQIQAFQLAKTEVTNDQ